MLNERPRDLHWGYCERTVERGASSELPANSQQLVNCLAGGINLCHCQSGQICVECPTLIYPSR